MLRFILRLGYYLAAIILIGSVVIYLYPPSEYVSSSPSMETLDITAQDKGIIYALAFDMYNTGKVTKESVLAGKDVVLALRAEASDKVNDHYIFNSLSSLYAYDQDKNNWLDVSDPVFLRLDLMSLTRSGERRFMGLEPSGVRAIQIDPAILDKDDESVIDKIVAQAVMTDGSRRNVYLIKLNMRKIPNTERWTVE